MNKIDIALERASDTKALAVGRGVIGQAAEMFANMFPGSRAVIVADENTYEAAGGQVMRSLDTKGIPHDEPFIFDTGVYAGWEWVERLDGVLSATDAIPIAVGSGIINDLVKLCSFRSGRRYMSVATAASMDGYTAFGASITYDGAKQTFPCPAPLAVLADTEILAAAPRELTASGYADMFAKIPAGADWILSDALGVEPVDDFAFSLVNDSLKEMLSDTAGIRNGEIGAVEKLMEGIFFGGFAMQAYQTSRPASGADHQFSHLWDMEHHVLENGRAPSHGFKVSIGLLASTALYEEFLAADISALDVEACAAAWHDRRTMELTAAEMFRGTDFPDIGTTEYGAKYIDADGLRLQLQSLKDNWKAIRRSLEEQLIPFGEAVRMLDAVGAPVLPEQINIPRARLRESYRKALYIRRRFTILDIADRCGKLGEWTDNIFAEGRLWEIG